MSPREKHLKAKGKASHKAKARKSNRTSKDVEKATWDIVFRLAQRCGVGDVLYKMPHQGVIALVEKYVDELEAKLRKSDVEWAKAVEQHDANKKLIHAEFDAVGAPQFGNEKCRIGARANWMRQKIAGVCAALRVDFTDVIRPEAPNDFDTLNIIAALVRAAIKAKAVESPAPAFKLGDKVVKNTATWIPNPIGRRAGTGIGKVVALAAGPNLVVQWPAGRCYHHANELLLAPEPADAVMA